MSKFGIVKGLTMLLLGRSRPPRGLEWPTPYLESPPNPFRTGDSLRTKMNLFSFVELISFWTSYLFDSFSVRDVNFLDFRLYHGTVYPLPRQYTEQVLNMCGIVTFGEVLFHTWTSSSSVLDSTVNLLFILFDPSRRWCLLPHTSIERKSIEIRDPKKSKYFTFLPVLCIVTFFVLTQGDDDIWY